MLTENQISDFQTLYENRFGRKLSRKEACDKGIQLVRLIELIYKPMTEAEYQQLQERRKQIGDL